MVHPWHVIPAHKARRAAEVAAAASPPPKTAKPPRRARAALVDRLKDKGPGA